MASRSLSLHSSGREISFMQIPLSDKTQHSQETNTCAPLGILHIWGMILLEADCLWDFLWSVRPKLAIGTSSWASRIQFTYIYLNSLSYILALSIIFQPKVCQYIWLLHVGHSCSHNHSNSCEDYKLSGVFNVIFSTFVLFHHKSKCCNHQSLFRHPKFESFYKNFGRNSAHIRN